MSRCVDCDRDMAPADAGYSLVCGPCHAKLSPQQKALVKVSRGINRAEVELVDRRFPGPQPFFLLDCRTARELV